MDKKTIMVIDDNKDMVKMLTGRLEMEGFDVVQAYNGREAIEKIDSKRPHLILLDIVMPIIDGNELVHRLRGNIFFKDIPIIFITALMTPQDSDPGGARLGNNLVFPKPFDSAQLLSTIRALL